MPTSLFSMSQPPSRADGEKAGVGAPPPAPQPDQEANIVDFAGPDDPYHPLNWPLKKKLVTTALYSLTTMSTPFASAVYSPGIDQIAAEFQVSRQVATVGLSVCLLQYVPRCGAVWSRKARAARDVFIRQVKRPR